MSFVTKIDVDYFYSRYLKNMEIEQELLQEMHQPHSQDGWMTYLDRRSHTMHDLYVENEALLNTYVRPFFIGKQSLDVDTALAFLSHTWSLYETKLEYVIVGQVTKMLEAFFEEHGMTNEHIKCLIILSELYLQTAGESGFAVARMYYDKLVVYRSRLSDIDSSLLLKYLCISSLRGLPVANSNLSSMDDCYRFYEDDLAFLSSDKVRSIIDSMEGITFESVRDYCKLLFIAKILNTYEVRLSDPVYEAVYPLYEETFLKGTKGLECEYDYNINIVLPYYKLCWLTGRSTAEECFEKYYGCYNHFKNAAVRDKDITLPLIERQLFSLMTMYLPDAFMLTNFLSADSFEENIDKLNEYLISINEFFDSVPFGDYDIYLSQQAYEIFEKILPTINRNMDVFTPLFNIVIRRDPDVTVHSYMVGNIASVILDLVIKEKPELLVGCLKLKNRDEVGKHKDMIKKYLEQGCLLHDLGKISIGYITRKQTRALSSGEFEFIRSHPELGAGLAMLNPQINRYTPIIIGHHKAYDDVSGYPSSYHYSEHHETFLVNIVKLADCLEAATDSIGRIYAPVKTSNEVLEEFRQGSGAMYNPDLVELIVNSPETVAKLSEITTTGRATVYERVYLKK